MDDSLGDRVWVDRADCRAFVENVQTAFGTRLPSVSMLASETGVKPESACKSDYSRALGFHLTGLFFHANWGFGKLSKHLPLRVTGAQPLIQTSCPF